MRYGIVEFMRGSDLMLLFVCCDGNEAWAVISHTVSMKCDTYKYVKTESRKQAHV